MVFTKVGERKGERKSLRERERMNKQIVATFLPQPQAVMSRSK